jgi:AbrB family looped-hinge helix DNA binding protein
MRVVLLNGEEHMKEQTTIITRKGQVTIPAEIREALNLKEGDTVAWHMENGEIRLRKSDSVVARTAGIMQHTKPVLSAEDERAAVEQAIAEDVVQRMSR